MHRNSIEISLVCAIVLCCFVANRVDSQFQRPLGGLGEEKSADDEVRGLVEEVENDIRAEFPRKFSSIEPLKYKIQLVSGKNYFIKALIHEKDGSKSYAHLRIYKSFRGPVDLASVKADVGKSDALVYF